MIAPFIHDHSQTHLFTVSLSLFCMHVRMCACPDTLSHSLAHTFTHTLTTHAHIHARTHVYTFFGPIYTFCEFAGPAIYSSHLLDTVQVLTACRMASRHLPSVHASSTSPLQHLTVLRLHRKTRSCS